MIRVALLPNDDGLGPSALGLRVARGLLGQTAGGLRLDVFTAGHAEFNRRLYHTEIPTGRVRVVALDAVCHRIVLPKRDGCLEEPATADLVRSYGRSRSEYARVPLESYDLVIDVALPQAVAQAVAGRAGSGRLGVVTVADHSWSYSLRRMLGGRIDPGIGRELSRMAQDEAAADAVFAFESYLCAPEYRVDWESRGLPVCSIGGVLGGPEDAIAWFHRNGRAVPAGGSDPALAARRAVRAVLGLDDRPAAYVSGGGGPVWSGLVRRMIARWQAEPARPYCPVVVAPGLVEEIDAGGLAGPGPGWRIADSPCPMVQVRAFGPGDPPELLVLGPATDETHHVLIAGFDLVVGRAGGGTVNDAIAHRVPLLLVEEPGHWQVEQIRHGCVRQGLAATCPLDPFRRDFAAIMPRVIADGRLRAAIRDRMAEVPNARDQWLARRLLGVVGEG